MTRIENKGHKKKHNPQTNLPGLGSGGDLQARSNLQLNFLGTKEVQSQTQRLESAGDSPPREEIFGKRFRWGPGEAFPKSGSYLEAAEAAAPGQGDIADVGGAGGRDHLVEYQGPVAQLGPARLLHLPEFLQRLHHVHCPTQPASAAATAGKKPRALPWQSGNAARKEGKGARGEGEGGEEGRKWGTEKRKRDTEIKKSEKRE